MITKIVDNFTGRLTRNNIGEMDSGAAIYNTTFGSNPFLNITNLTWFESLTQIDPNASVITDLIVAAKPRLESGITYVYAIGHTGRLYKIQVNDPTTYNPNYDNPVLLTTLTAQSPTFKYGASIQFYGTTERIYIGHDMGITQIDFNGTNETFKGTLSSYTQGVPRPSVVFQGVTYWGNGNNLAAIDSTNTVTTYGKLSPAFETNTFIRDLDVSPNGNYIQIITSRLNSPDLTSTTQDTTSLSSGDSYKSLWNGSDVGVTSRETYAGYSINSNSSFGAYSYTMGYDLGGAAIYTQGSKIISLPNSISPNFGAMFSTGNMLGFAAPETSNNALKGSLFVYGQYDHEVAKGLYRLLQFSATSPETNVIQIPMCLVVSNLFYGSSSAGYSGNQVGSAKLYISTLETSSAPTTKYRLYKFTTVPTGLGNAIGGVYQTQAQTSYKLFRSIIKKGVVAKEVRMYTEPLVTNNSFKIDLIGTDGNPISGTSQTFTVGSTAVAGVEYVQYNPTMKPTHALGLRITNLGTANWVGLKCEIDVEEAGK